MIFTAPLRSRPEAQAASGTGLTFTSGEYELLASNSSPPAGLRGFIEPEINAACEYSHLFAMGFSSTPSAADVEFITDDADGDLLLIALYIDGDSNSRIAIRKRPEGSSSWGAWQDYTPPIGSDSPTGDHALVRDYPFLLITESDLGNNPTLAQIVQSNPRFFRGEDSGEVLLAFRDYGIFIPCEYELGSNYDFISEYGLTGFSTPPTQRRYRTDTYAIESAGNFLSCETQDIADSTLTSVFCFNNSQNTGLPLGANWGLAYFFRAPERLITWDGKLAGEVRSNGRIYIDERGELMAQHMRVLIPRTARVTGLSIQLSAADQAKLSHVNFSKTGAVLHPSPAADCRLYYPKSSVRRIDGRWHIARAVDDVFRGSLRLNGYGTTAVLDDLAALDGVDGFACWPSGLDSKFATGDHATGWRRPGFARNCAYSRFTGWRGHDGYDLGAQRGAISFREIA